MADEVENDDNDLYFRWKKEVIRYERETNRWTERSKKIVKRYKDERNDYDNNLSRFNILWSNVQTLQPLIYAREPKPSVIRRHRDPDKLGRTSAKVLQRTLEYMIACTPFGETLRCCTLDL